MVWIENNWPFGQENRFCAKKHLIFAYFGGHESELPDFGRTWTPNHWHQVNFWGTPVKFGLWQFNWAMWKIERTAPRNFFTTGIFWALYPLRIPNMYMVGGRGPPFPSYRGSKWDDRLKMGRMMKNKRRPKRLHSANFRFGWKENMIFEGYFDWFWVCQK